MQPPNGSFPKAIYRGEIISFPVKLRQQIVSVNGSPLPQRQEISNQSDGLSWGYRGAGAQQLAVALTAHALGEEVARGWYHVILDKIVSVLEQEKPWVITEYQVWDCLYYYSDEARTFLREHGVYPE